MDWSDQDYAKREEFGALFENLVPRAVRQVCRPTLPPGRSNFNSISNTSTNNSIFGNNNGGQSNSSRAAILNVKQKLPVMVETVGAVGIIDVSGYTALTEKLFDVNDNAGGERVYNAVNPFFDGIIKTIHKCE
jgi:hypothetical protein